jgi:hypothetical protein
MKFQTPVHEMLKVLGALGVSLSSAKYARTVLASFSLRDVCFSSFCSVNSTARGARTSWTLAFSRSVNVPDFSEANTKDVPYFVPEMY